MGGIKDAILNFISLSSKDHTFNDLDDILKTHFKKKIYWSIIVLIIAAIMAFIARSLMVFAGGVLISIMVIVMVMEEVQDCFKGNIESYRGTVDTISEQSKIRRRYLLLKHEGGAFIKVYIPKSFDAGKNYEVVVYADKTSCRLENTNTLLITNPLLISIEKTAEDTSIEQDNKDL